MFVTVIEFKSVLHCYQRIDVCCTYRLRIANLFFGLIHILQAEHDQ